MPDTMTCAVCRRPWPGKTDRFGQHECPGFGKLACCGRTVETLSGADTAGHRCEGRQRVTVVDDVGPVTAVTVNDDGIVSLHFEIIASHEDDVEMEAESDG